jgi:Zincin-like metallopeptidase/Ku70/Ku80 beta-barrel domain
VSPRPYWKGYLKLSLVSCPIALHAACSSTERISFRQINRKTGNRLRQQLVDEETREAVEAYDKARGYETRKGQCCKRQSNRNKLSLSAAPPEPGLIEPTMEALIKATGIDVLIGGGRAFYMPAHDYVQVPPPQAYFEPIIGGFPTLGIHAAETRLRGWGGRIRTSVCKVKFHLFELLAIF